MKVHRPSLGRPTRGLTLSQLYARPGKGNSLTCFAVFALYDWRENIPPIPSKMSRGDRRELIFHLARCVHLDVLDMMAVILLKLREERAKDAKRRTA
ncbi:hypothetical protein K2P47_03235 [Patescibacteria group bacterium]|nr:hypothetical protein [Patescibacteria group bacterium]